MKSIDENDDCDLCGGCEEVEITSRVDSTYSDSFGCPKCMGREFEAQRADYKSRNDDLLALAKQFEKTIEYYIGVSKRDGDDEGARLKTATLNMVRATIAKVEGRS